MPRFSIIVPAYNVAQYLPACLDSIKRQTLFDWETIVVVDASPDESAGIARGFAAADSRFKVIEKSENEGLHLARRTGVLAAQGEWTLFVDGDDELMPGALRSLSQALDQQPCDLLRFGCVVEPAGASQEACDAYAARANREFPPLSGAESIHLAFEQAGGYVQDWRAWANVLRTSIAKRSFKEMTNERLDRAEDSYEFLVWLSLVDVQVTRTDIKGYRYQFGRGVTGSGSLNAQTFNKHVSQFARCMQALRDYADTYKKADLHAAAEGACAKLAEIMSNDWHDRVADEDKIAAAQHAASVLSADTVASELMRIVRDEAYTYCTHDEAPQLDAPIYEWAHLANELIENETPSQRFKGFETMAKTHMDDVAKIRALNAGANERIRIFVATHKPSDRFESAILQPIQVGAGAAANRLFGTLRDDTGDNITELNPMYCELTAQYWAWKNVDADYYGFCHYRRYFDFSDERHEENAWGEVMDDFIDAEAQERYGLTDEAIRKAVEGFDIITTELKDIREFPYPESDHVATPVDQWHAAESLVDEDLITLFAIVSEMHPDYAEDVEAFANGNYSRFCNMFIMRKDIFGSYCNWLFPILEHFMAATNMSRYSAEALRTPGHLAERLLNIFIAHHERIGSNWNVKQVQCVHFNRPEPFYVPIPLTSSNVVKPIVPVVFASDDNYAPMLTTTMYSMLVNASNDYHYDIMVLTDNITAESQRLMRECLSGIRDITLRFCYVARMIENQSDLTTNNAHIGIETYYRFLIQDVLPFYDKVVYLDSDLIVLGDVSELFNTELGDNLLAAVRDADYLGNLNCKDGKRMAYTKDVLGMKEPYDYFQAGVLVLNTAQLRATMPTSEWMKIAQDPKYIYNDQDILNEYCEGRVVFLDYSWNVMHNGFNRIGNFIAKAPADVYRAFQKSRTCEKVIHYAGAEKPWATVDCDRGEVYWSYARKTPFYEKLIGLLAYSSSNNPQWTPRSMKKNPDEVWVVSANNPLRKIVDPLLPYDSRRREVVRNAIAKVKGIKR